MTQTSHFKGKEALSHVVEAQGRGVIASSELHGIEMPGYLSAAADALRETSLLLLLLGIFLSFQSLVIFSFAWLLWKGGRAGWLGWQRLERLHRLRAEEGWEIQHNRPQERSELKELYRAKGFQGKLLDDVIDVLMADDDRLLKVMIEEEMGLQLEALDHPLKQGIGAAGGVFVGAASCLLGLYLAGLMGLAAFSLTTLGAGALLSAYSEKNHMVSAVVWNVALGCLAFGTLYFLLQAAGG